MSAVTLLAALSTALLAPALVVAAVIDLVRWARRRTPWMAVRLYAFGWFYALVEVLGIVWLGCVWVASGLGRNERQLVRWTFATQRWWTRTLFRAIRVVFRLRLRVEGEDAIRPGPILVMARHTSMIDTMLPSNVVTIGQGIRLAFVLKRELLVDPCLDIAGHRLPNHFVDRSGVDSAREVAAVRALASGLGRDEGVLIYPEGTRVTAAKRARALKRLAQGDPQLFALAQTLEHTLPPRLGGPMALLDACDADVVFLAHHGLETFATLAAMWSGAAIGSTITVQLWRAPRAEIPSDGPLRALWLYEWWQRVDRWVGDIDDRDSDGVS